MAPKWLTPRARRKLEDEVPVRFVSFERVPSQSSLVTDPSHEFGFLSDDFHQELSHDVSPVSVNPLIISEEESDQPASSGLSVPQFDAEGADRLDSTMFRSQGHVATVGLLFSGFVGLEIIHLNAQLQTVYAFSMKCGGLFVLSVLALVPSDVGHYLESSASRKLRLYIAYCLLSMYIVDLTCKVPNIPDVSSFHPALVIPKVSDIVESGNALISTLDIIPDLSGKQNETGIQNPVGDRSTGRVDDTVEVEFGSFEGQGHQFGWLTSLASDIGLPEKAGQGADKNEIIVNKEKSLQTGEVVKDKQEAEVEAGGAKKKCKFHFCLNPMAFGV